MNRAGDQHPDRDAQFRHINEAAQSYITGRISDHLRGMQKEGKHRQFQEHGSECSPQNQPAKALDHDVSLPKPGEAAPHGMYDAVADEGFVSAGISADTAQFAVNSVCSWWNEMGREKYPAADKLLLTVNSGGRRNRLWETELQKFAGEARLDIAVCHFLPGISKWNKIEQRLFSQITKNWRGRPLETVEVIVRLIAST